MNHRTLRRQLGLLRSLAIYWRPGRQAGLRRLYAPFVGPGDLVFDVGAHLGDRACAFDGLGARVVALEPQPHVRRWLERVCARRPRITVRPEAVGAAAGEVELAMSPGNPTIASASAAWRKAVRAGNAGFRGVAWQESIRVPVTTLDDLIAHYGEPVFCKIDVEGFEASVLAGLSRPLAALSFEFVGGCLEAARACVDRLEQLGRHDYNVIPGEGRRFLFPDWCDAAALTAWLDGGGDGFASGDVYARRRPAAAPGELP